jgi:hypothetical protein
VEVKSGTDAEHDAGTERFEVRCHEAFLFRGAEPNPHIVGVFLPELLCQRLDLGSL